LGQNTKYTVAVTRRLPISCERQLESLYHVYWGSDDNDLSPEEIIALSNKADALIVTPSESLSSQTIEQFHPRCKIISCFSVGYEHVSIAAAKAKNIVITNTPGVLTEATADIALLLILGATRRAAEGERLMRSGGWTGWRPTQLVGSDIYGKTLGIFGMGRIGQAVAKRAIGFGMNVIYHNRNQAKVPLSLNIKYISTPEELLTKSDVLTIHAPLTEDTMGFFNQKRIGLLPKGAVLVNTSRGPLINDNALIDALKNGSISSAGLDVYAHEPNFDPRYKSLANTFLLPHLGSATNSTREAMGMMAIDNIKDFISSGSPKNRVV
jgi:lactate dehydrogenase-like 2-hydroxyacid dehydrogenase